MYVYLFKILRTGVTYNSLINIKNIATLYQSMYFDQNLSKELSEVWFIISQICLCVQLEVFQNTLQVFFHVLPLTSLMFMNKKNMQLTPAREVQQKLLDYFLSKCNFISCSE